MRLRRRPISVATALLSMVVVALALPGCAGPASTAVVQSNPADWTPNLVADGVESAPVAYGVWQVGSLTYVGGRFHAVQRSNRTGTVTRGNLVGFDNSGNILPFAPSFDGPVWQIRNIGDALYVAGAFNNVSDARGGHYHRGIAKVSASTGLVDDTFNASATIPAGRGYASDVRIAQNRVIVAGDFPKALAALDPVTGADTNYLNLGISGSLASNAGTTNVYRFDVDPSGTRLVAIGNFTTVGGQRHYRAFMVNLGATATLNPWRYVPLEHMCMATTEPAYLNDVGFDPTGGYFVFVSTGFHAPSLGYDICDAAARFETNNPAPARPTWINYTGGDTLQSVAATGGAVYIQGHERWANNPQGANTCGPGCVSRPGIGALDPNSGLALPWNPTKDRGVGGKDLLATDSGLWVVSDTAQIGGEYHRGIALLPY